MRSRTGAALLVATALLAAQMPTASAGGSVPPVGFVDGREHEVRIRSVLAELPAAKTELSRSARAAAVAAIATCDPAAVRALGRKIVTTRRSGDAPSACVVLPAPGSKQLLLLGPARLTGSEIDTVSTPSTPKGGRNVVARLSTRGATRWQFGAATVGTAPLAVTVDGAVVERAGVGPDPQRPELLAVVLGGRRGFDEEDADRLRELIEQSRHEEVIELGRTASMSRAGRVIFAATEPRIDEKVDFPDDCPSPENSQSFVLGCYYSGSNDLFILRVDRADLAGIMPVTAAHEMLHAAYEQLSASRRAEVDTMIAEFLATTPIPRIQETLAEYDLEDPSVHESEAHSLVGTEVRSLPPELERYYDRYFDDRSALVTLFEGYQQVFDNLETAQERLVAEIDALDGRLRSLLGQASAAGAEADRLFNEITALRNQGRIDESNALVDDQNAAVNRANSLFSQYNALVVEYNAKVAELNALALAANDLYETISPTEPSG